MSIRSDIEVDLLYEAFHIVSIIAGFSTLSNENFSCDLKLTTQFFQFLKEIVDSCGHSSKHVLLINTVSSNLIDFVVNLEAEESIIHALNLCAVILKTQRNSSDLSRHKFIQILILCVRMLHAKCSNDERSIAVLLTFKEYLLSNSRFMTKFIFEFEVFPAIIHHITHGNRQVRVLSLEIICKLFEILTETVFYKQKLCIARCNLLTHIQACFIRGDIDEVRYGIHILAIIASNAEAGYGLIHFSILPYISHWLRVKHGSVIYSSLLLVEKYLYYADAEQERVLLENDRYGVIAAIVNIFLCTPEETVYKRDKREPRIILLCLVKIVRFIEINARAKKEKDTTNDGQSTVKAELFRTITILTSNEFIIKVGTIKGCGWFTRKRDEVLFNIEKIKYREMSPAQ